MGAQRTLQEILDDPSFRLDLMENVFQLFIAMGSESNHRVLDIAKERLFFGVKHLPQIGELAIRFTDFLDIRFPLSGLTKEEHNSAVHLLHCAQRGAGSWNREFLRFAQMQALLIAHEHRLLKSGSS
jgi:hypothetical protein